MIKTSNPLAPNVASGFGAPCVYDGSEFYYIGGGVTQSDFEMGLACSIKNNEKPMSCKVNAAYKNLQTEGYGY